MQFSETFKLKTIVIKEIIFKQKTQSYKYLKIVLNFKSILNFLNINLSIKKKDKKTIVFDLDETLIHCNENIYLPYDVKIVVDFPTGE